MEHTAAVGEIPESGVATAEQAESALGRTMATERDQDMLDAVDAGTKEEEDAPAGRQVNPPDVDYSCICWQPRSPDSLSALAVGWGAGRGTPSLSRADFACAPAGVSMIFHAGPASAGRSSRADFRQSGQQSDFASRAARSGPAQKLVVGALKEWAEKR